MLRLTLGQTRLTLTFGFAAVICAVFVFEPPQPAVAGVLCVLWHETGHLLALIAFGNPPAQVRMTVLGIEIRRLRPCGYGHAAVVSLAGPVANLLAAGVLALLPGFEDAARLQGMLGCFHLLPVLPLDGGQALEAVLSLIWPRARAEIISFAVSWMLLIPLGALGFLFLFSEAPNPGLLVLCLYLLFYLVFGQRE